MTNDPYLRALTFFRGNYVRLGIGRHREVFASKRGWSVIKVPREPQGDDANERELIRDNWLGDPERYARAWRDVEHSQRFRVVIIRMERLDLEIPSPEALPDWCGAVDGFQVGYDKRRLLRAYDWG